MFLSTFNNMVRRNLLLISSSNVHGHTYLDYCSTDIKTFLKKNNASKILFIPYAQADYNKYYDKVNTVFSSWEFAVESIHHFKDAPTAVANAQAIFIGGGNTFLLLKTLYEKNLIGAIRKRILQDGRPYIGTSAGTNVATVSINTTNDMPIVCPPSFEALNLVPFNINPHYLDDDSNSTHKGETREQRLLEYLEVGAKNRPVLAMREGVHLLVEDDTAKLMGIKSSRLYMNGQQVKELEPGTDVSYLLKKQRNLLLISSSNVHGHSYLGYCSTDITNFLKKNNASKVLFIPYALPDYDKYFEKVNKVISSWGFSVESIHHHKDPITAISNAESIFIGGGNTFLLLKTLYEKNLIDQIRTRILDDGRPYIGTSAGTNVATVSINTTNDMPITLPPSFQALNLVPFNINPHYLDPEENSTHKGETREERLLQYLQVNNENRTVLALREGVHLLVENDSAKLMGIKNSRLYIHGQPPRELESGSDVSFLLKNESSS